MAQYAGQMSDTIAADGINWLVANGWYVSRVYAYDYFRNIGYQVGGRGIGLCALPAWSPGWVVRVFDDSTQPDLPGAPIATDPPQ
jgi:hypothetical protein